MTDLHTLHDAFTELERRADAVVPAARRQPHRGFRLLPIAVMAAVAALAAGAMWLVPTDTTGTRVGDQSPSGSPSDIEEAPPLTPEALADKFKAVLGDIATFEVTKGMPVANGGAMITGTLTADGVTGGFILAMYNTTSEMTCDPPTCRVVYESDGTGIVSVIQTQHTQSKGTTLGVYSFLDGGTVISLRISNTRVPDEDSEVLAPQPPLTTDQMITIITSDRW